MSRDRGNRSMLRRSIILLLTLLASPLQAEETFTPYQENAEVPRNVVDLWKDYDARKEPLDIRVLKEWQTEGVIVRYVTFKVGTFKGSEARIAAYYSFPDDGREHAAFVWSHGGGQRADRNRGLYFAKQGFATLDINWLGRPLEDDIEINTDWGKVDPTQGRRFYSKALREGWKRNLQPDEHTIDPVPSPRNANWFLLTVAARRAITFLEQQPAVDANRIGFSGFSMGGMITSLVAIDPRLKAVAPFVGGTGFKHVDFPGKIAGSGISTSFKDLALYESTIDASVYWPLVKCPVVFITSSNDFHSTFERVYQSMALLEHKNWRVTCNVHQNHAPDPEQWVMLNLWFEQYLKGRPQNIPPTPPSTLTVNGKTASFTVTPSSPSKLLNTEIFYSYDPNSRTRFWERATATQSGANWTAELAVQEALPLYVFAICRYQLPGTVPLERGETSTYTLNSTEQMIVPESVDRNALTKLQGPEMIFEDFENGTRDWSSRDGRTIRTYKFQSHYMDRSNTKQFAMTINPQGEALSLRLHAESQFLSREDNLGRFTFTKRIEGKDPQLIRIRRDDFQSDDGKALEWSKITTLDVTLVNEATKERVKLASPKGFKTLRRIELIDTP